MSRQAQEGATPGGHKPVGCGFPNASLGQSQRGSRIATGRRRIAFRMDARGRP
jgi:hypothetical protein